MTHIAFGIDDGTVQIWDVLSKSPVTYNGKPVAYNDGSDKSVKAVAWSPDGNLIASSSEDGTMHIWNAATGGKVINDPYFLPGNVVINAVAWSFDNKRIAYAGTDGTVQEYAIKDFVDHKKLSSFPKQGENFTAGAWSPDLQRIVSVGNGKTIQLFNATSGSTICNLPNTKNKKCP